MYGNYQKAFIIAYLHGLRSIQRIRSLSNTTRFLYKTTHSTTRDNASDSRENPKHLHYVDNHDRFNTFEEQENVTNHRRTLYNTRPIQKQREPLRH